MQITKNGTMSLQVKGWKEFYENHRTRILKRMDWVPVKNKMDGDGYTELVNHANGAAHFGVWVSLLQIASKCKTRGLLQKDDGKPHTVSNLSRISRLPESLFLEAIPRLIEIGWLELIPSGNHPSGVGETPTPKLQNDRHMAFPGADPAFSSGRMEWNGMEGNGTEGKGTEPAPAAATPKPKAEPEKEIPLDETPFGTTDGTPLAVIDENHPQTILAECEEIYLRAGKPVSESHKIEILRYLSEITPPENRHRVPNYVKKCLVDGTWPSPAKTKSLFNLLLSGDWNVPLVARTLPNISRSESSHDRRMRILRERGRINP